MKQRIMSFLYRRAQSDGFLLLNNFRSISHFFTTLSNFESLVMCRMQFIDDNHIIIKYLSPSRYDYSSCLFISIFSKSQDWSSYTAFYVFFSLETTDILAIYESNSQQLLEVYLHLDIFRAESFGDKQIPIFYSAPSNCEFARESVQKLMLTVLKAKNGGHAQSIRRILSNIPLNPQCFSSSPYYDTKLYAFDDKIVNSWEKFRPMNNDNAIKFYSRTTGRVVFKIGICLNALKTCRNQ